MATAAGADGVRGAFVQLRDRAREAARPDASREACHRFLGEFLSGAQRLAAQVRELRTGVP
eukprot:3716386-Lingulodinium_polyedra.AAC.1